MPVALPAEKSCFICCNGRSEKGVAPLPCLLLFSTDKLFVATKISLKLLSISSSFRKKRKKMGVLFNGIPFPSSPSQPRKNKDHTRHPKNRVGPAPFPAMAHAVPPSSARPLPKNLGRSPALVMAPMVKQSDRAFRALVRRRGNFGGRPTSHFLGQSGHGLAFEDGCC